MTHPFSVFNRSTCNDPDGFSNYYVKVLGSDSTETRAMLWFFDTHSTLCEGKDISNGCINSYQIDWFKSEMTTL